MVKNLNNRYRGSINYNFSVSKYRFNKYSLAIRIIPIFRKKLFLVYQAMCYVYCSNFYRILCLNNTKSQIANNHEGWRANPALLFIARVFNQVLSDHRQRSVNKFPFNILRCSEYCYSYSSNL